LGYLEGDSETLLQALQVDIEKNGGEIKLQSPVIKVLMDGGKVTGVDTSAGVELFDTVINTIPLSYIPRVMPDLPTTILDQFKAVKNIAVVCVIAKLRCKVTENFWLNTNDPEMDIPGLVEYSNLRPLDQHVIYVPFYMPCDHHKFSESDEIFLKKVRTYLKKINVNYMMKIF
jgi:protoporphyrinogen oxidase